MARERPVEEQDTNSIPLVNRSMLPPRRHEIKSEKGPSLGNWLIDLNIIIRGIRYCLSVRVGVMCLATSFAIFLCSKAVLNLKYNTSLEIVTYGTIFPLTFGIQCAFGHREGAIKGLATVKALCAAIYMQANAWDRSGTGVIAEKLRSILMEMTKNMEIYCRNPINTQISYPVSRPLCLRCVCKIGRGIWAPWPRHGLWSSRHKGWFSGQGSSDWESKTLDMCMGEC